MYEGCVEYSSSSDSKVGDGNVCIKSIYRVYEYSEVKIPAWHCMADEPYKDID